MISRLRGKIIEKSPPEIVLDVNGVGYELQASMNTIYSLPDSGKNVSLFTQLIVRDDAHLLYAFADKNERSVFRTLLKVNGVGAKMALAILSGMTPAEFHQAIHNGDNATLIRLPGVGKKTAERLIVELRDRLPDVTELRGQQTLLDRSPQTANEKNHENEAVNALLALGYKPTQASRMISNVMQQTNAEILSVEAIIRQALQNSVQ